MKKPTVKQMKKRPSLWTREVALGTQLIVCHPSGLVEVCLAFDANWMTSGWNHLQVKKIVNF